MKNPLNRISHKPKGKAVSTTRGLSFTQGVILLVAATIGLFAVSGYYWYKFVLTDPDRVLAGMLDKSMQTSSLYKTIDQTGGQTTLKQTSYTSYSPDLVAQSLTTLEEASASGKTTVVTETVGTKNSDFVRYNDIKIEGLQSLKGVDNVLGVWGKRDADVGSGQQTTFLNEALFVAVPFGKLNHDQRTRVMDTIRETNLYQIQDAKMQYENGRPVMNYTIQLDPQKLVQVLATYAKVTGAIDISQLDPSAYEGAQSIDLKFEVDVLSRHLKTIEFANTGRKEHYRGLNAVREVPQPMQTISVEELQTRLQSVEQQVQAQ